MSVKSLPGPLCRLLPCSGLLLVCALFAQQPSGEVVLRTTTRLVEVNVVVKDKKGRFITDLKQEDFIVEDEGRRQQIRVFGVESAAAPSEQLRTAPAATFSNRHAERSGVSGGVTAILLDGLNTSWGDQNSARSQVVKFLLQIEPRDRIALYTLGRELRVLHDYTTEPAALVKALTEYLGSAAPELAASHSNLPAVIEAAAAETAGPEDAEFASEAIQGIINALKEEEFFFKQSRIQITLKALEAIANHLSGVPGRKNLVWVSGSFPIELGYFEQTGGGMGPSAESSEGPRSARYGSLRGRPPVVQTPDLTMVKHGRSRTFGEELERAARALNAANLSVYPVDARGLTTNPAASQNISTMRDLASKTGGIAYYNTNDLMNSIREAVEDSKASYTLGYYPSELRHDGRFRRIRVRLKRSGLVVRHRQGYYDVRELPSTEELAATEIRDALWSPLDAAGVSLEARVSSGPSSGPLLLLVNIGPAGIALEPRDGRWTGKLDVYFLQTDEQGEEYDARSQTVSLDLQQETFETVLRHGIAYRHALERKEEATALRILVRDHRSGNIGRVVIPFRGLP